MKKDQEMYPGGQKKFLYQTPKSGKSARSEDAQWSFTPRKAGQATSESQFDLDDVWSIKKNVSLKKTPKTDSLNLNVNTHFYSRHGGLKDRGGIGPSQDSSSRTPLTLDGNRSWTAGRRGFSYSSQNPPNQKTANITATPTNEDSPGLTDDRQTVNGYRFGNSTKNNDPFRF